jgi:hypothetical protein
MVPLSRRIIIIELEVSAMKKIGLIIAGIFLSVFLLAGGVWAGTASSNGKITIADSVGPDLEYEESPNVHMYYTDEGDDGYFITSVNAKGTIEYGIVSDYSGYYQHIVGSGNHTDATAAANVTGVEGWTKVGFN